MLLALEVLLGMGKDCVEFRLADDAPPPLRRGGRGFSLGGGATAHSDGYSVMMLVRLDGFLSPWRTLLATVGRTLVVVSLEDKAKLMPGG